MRIQRCSKEPPAAEDTHHARRKSEVKEEGQRKETKPIINLLYKQKERERERETVVYQYFKSIISKTHMCEKIFLRPLST
jgi:hypothetical protein